MVTLIRLQYEVRGEACERILKGLYLHTQISPSPTPSPTDLALALAFRPRTLYTDYRILARWLCGTSQTTSS
jgi:hypothetical protein